MVRKLSRTAGSEDLFFPSIPPATNKAVASWNQPGPTTHRIRISGIIGEIESLADEIEILENAKADDIVIMQICSPGGSLFTTDFFCRRMDACQARIIAEIGMDCASGATVMALHADDWILADSSTFMVHSLSWGPGYGKESDIRYSVNFTERLARDFAKRTYAGFLSEEEMIKILDDGRDMYMFADELAERLEKYAEYRAAQEAESEEVVDTDENS